MMKTAAPSWVMAGSVYENCVFLEGKVDEVALLFFESESCLAYDESDLPRELAELDLTYHVHLPLDLPWDDADEAARIVLGLMDKVRFLGVRQAVLHPPVTTGKNAFSVEATQQLLTVVTRAWCSHGFDCNDLLIENIEGADLIDLAPVIEDLGLGVCIDIGHIIAYGHDALLDRTDIFDRLRMVHINAPADIGTVKGRSKHVSLVHLDEAGRGVARKVLQACGEDCTLVYELFNWKHIETTIPIVEELLLMEGQ
ncbi:MAG: cobamide remodeling phosphodiesterase CbiR [Halodesulfovibrio sp.]|uniref:cobamide remodeling phosphodiesterase CbiR n=1 Tax=Halodesulfovibrio sp. TaxID=1912772 RepID=UPI00359DBC4B